MNLVKWHGLDIDPMIINESVTTKPVIGQIDTAFNEHTNESGITVLYPKIEAIHEGRTRNFNRYLGEKLKGNHELKSGVYSWTAPFPKPVIHNHDVNTEATGRVYSASYSEYTSAGRPGIIVTPKITQEKAIKDVLEGRLLTVSIGATTNAAVCSVCGTDIINEGWCGHMRGEEYDGQTCEWVAGDLWFDELSWVNVPADSDAMIVATNAAPSVAAVGESGGGKIVTGTIDASKIVVAETASNTELTAEPEVVKSESESTEKEERTVTNEEQKPVTDAAESTETAVEENATKETETTEETVVVEEEKVEESSETVVEEDEKEDVTKTEESPAEAENQVQEDVEQIKQELEESKKTVEELTAANEALAKELSETVAGFLVDLRVATGKESNREEAMAKYAVRSLESLRDSIADLLADKPAIKTTRTVESVEMPKGEEIVTESKTMTTESVKVISNEDALISLLTGRRN
ncbi:hypothetical protein [Cytobacillus oceanisediminis]|uniref:hypothetical protein n=1 Tax=Cytobacillus oceanisediminis TaxID=665099 RepID=UPI001FB1C652|nr:hypothetical protein [Cytobacillus oceanisediminis]UOE58094.1 hypothetical protein IRB79_26630 [Cytobacillus oceanisediminis]